MSIDEDKSPIFHVIVDDLDGVMAHLAECGVKIELGSVETTVGRQVFIKDPKVILRQNMVSFRYKKYLWTCLSDAGSKKYKL